MPEIIILFAAVYLLAVYGLLSLAKRIVKTSQVSSAEARLSSDAH